MAIKVIDSPVKSLSPDANSKHQVTIIKQVQGNSVSYYGKYKIQKEQRHLNNKQAYKIESLNTNVPEDEEKKSIRRHLQLEEYCKHDRVFDSHIINEIY